MTYNVSGGTLSLTQSINQKLVQGLTRIFPTPGQAPDCFTVFRTSHQVQQLLVTTSRTVART